MRKVTAQRLAEFTERDYVLTFGVGKREFDRMLAALEDAYRREHKRKPRFTKITMLDKLVLTLIYRHEYRSMDSIAAEYEVSRDTIEVNVHWVEQTLLNGSRKALPVCTKPTETGSGTKSLDSVPELFYLLAFIAGILAGMHNSAP